MEQQATFQGDPAPSFQLERLWLPGLVAISVIAAALAAGFIVGPGGNSFITRFLAGSGNSSGSISDVGVWLPFGFAFIAGMVATVNPCGFVMLPAYLGMYMSDRQGSEVAMNPAAARILALILAPALVWLFIRITFGIFIQPPFLVSFLLILSAFLYLIALFIAVILNVRVIFRGILRRIKNPVRTTRETLVAVRPVLLQLMKALYVSAALGLGFVVLFGAVGLTVSAGARSVATVFPWLSFTLGFIMTLLGAYLFAGGKLYTGAAQSAASRIGDPRDQSLRGYFLFGLSYATASLSCTLPIFLGIVTASLATDGVAGAAGQFLAYALGMAFVITVLTVSIAVFKGALVNQFRRLMPYLNSISAGILILVGGYLIFYWLTEGELARKLGVG